MAEKAFTSESIAQRVTFGSGTRHSLGSELRRLGITKVLILSGAQQESVARELADRTVDFHPTTFAGARMHTPVETTESALDIVTNLRVDGLVAIGGGSAIGLSKALALRTALPQVVLPTTYAGSEATDILGETVGGEKKTRRDRGIVPQTVIYDAELTFSLSPSASACSGLNAIAHGVEALYAKDRSPLSTLMAREGIDALAKALPEIVEAPRAVGPRHDALYGAWLCGIVLRSTAMALHHKLCHVLGGAFGLPHAETHSVILPHAVAFNRDAAGDAMHELGTVLGSKDAAQAVFDLARRLGAPASLREIGMPEGGLERAAELALADPYWNPRSLEREGIRSLLDDAWHGRRPPE